MLEYPFLKFSGNCVIKILHILKYPVTDCVKLPSLANQKDYLGFKTEKFSFGMNFANVCQFSRFNQLVFDTSLYFQHTLD